jgi:hypothetical protein
MSFRRELARAAHHGPCLVVHGWPFGSSRGR